jgi:hypothetical protein
MRALGGNTTEPVRDGPCAGLTGALLTLFGAGGAADRLRPRRVARGPPPARSLISDCADPNLKLARRRLTKEGRMN